MADDVASYMPPDYGSYSGSYNNSPPVDYQVPDISSYQAPAPVAPSSNYSVVDSVLGSGWSPASQDFSVLGRPLSATEVSSFGLGEIPSGQVVPLKISADRGRFEVSSESSGGLSYDPSSRMLVLPTDKASLALSPLTKAGAGADPNSWSTTYARMALGLQSPRAPVAGYPPPPTIGRESDTLGKIASDWVRDPHFWVGNLANPTIPGAWDRLNAEMKSAFGPPGPHTNHPLEGADSALPHTRSPLESAAGAAIEGPHTGSIEGADSALPHTKFPLEPSESAPGVASGPHTESIEGADSALPHTRSRLEVAGTLLDHVAPQLQIVGGGAKDASGAVLVGYARNLTGLDGRSLSPGEYLVDRTNKDLVKTGSTALDGLTKFGPGAQFIRVDAEGNARLYRQDDADTAKVDYAKVAVDPNVARYTAAAPLKYNQSMVDRGVNGASAIEGSMRGADGNAWLPAEGVPDGFYQVTTDFNGKSVFHTTDSGDPNAVRVSGGRYNSKQAWMEPADEKSFWDKPSAGFIVQGSVGILGLLATYIISEKNRVQSLKLARDNRNMQLEALAMQYAARSGGGGGDGDGGNAVVGGNIMRG